MSTATPPSRRWSAADYLSRRLALGLALIVAAVAVFGFIARGVADDGALTRFDLRVAHAMEEHANGHRGLAWFLARITDAGDEQMIAGMAVGLAIGLLVSGRRRLSLVVMIAIVGGAFLDGEIKEVFHRSRPPNPDPLVAPRLAVYAGGHSNVSRVRGLSFPSGHSMGSVIGYGMVGYLMVLHARRRWARWVVLAFLSCLVLLIGFSRLYLRAHWCSDVAGGFAAGTAWLTVCLAVLEGARRMRNDE